MANNPETQPLLSALLDPPCETHNNSDAKKKRFRRCKTIPSLDLTSEPNKDIRTGLFRGSKFIFSNLRPSFRQVALFLVLYLLAGVVCFYIVRHQIKGEKTNGILDALYFCVVTMTTVGYGDLVPNSVTSKLLACLFVFTGMAIIALFVSKAADYLVEKQEILLVKALHLRNKVGEAHMLRDIEINRMKYKFLMTTLSLLVLMITGTVILLKVEGLGLVDAFYCVCSTITTLGYGDKSFSTEGGRIFAVFWILASTICVAQFFLYLAELNTERRQHMLAKWVLTRRMTYVDLEAADLDGDGAVGAAEFIIYKLKELGKISQEDIALVMEEFEDLDADQSGKISTSDINSQAAP
ncbi:hypothetical protein J5N97_008392 [Dioscorea zingiberensis]|uniref:Uncharacterized protein n=1 Tax=Dioscorea zingiberensis TaxID=325984 RepID=A0A9D5CW83_9LILI|nr:hypothetical protein J5N97_008392 [Dioscorea zingiberensis]